MAEAKISVSHDQFTCSVCLELLRDPVTTACGHNYCKQCIEDYWDSTGMYKCPQCRMVFVLKPILQRNTILAEVVEELNKFDLSSGPREHFISPRDVLCDVCIGTKMRAVQTCLTCLASFCETHVQPHRVSEALRKHKLEIPFADLKRKLCLRHQKAVEIYCRTDQTCICYLCAATEHKSHDTVTPDMERAERQAQLLTSLSDIKEKIQSKEKTLAKVTVTIAKLKRSADTEIREYEKTFTSLLRSIERLRSQVTEVVRDHEQREVKRAEELKKRLEKEIEELKRRNTELVELSQTDDDIHFLQKFPSVRACSESQDTTNTAINVHFFLEDLRENLSNLQKCLKEVSCWKFVNISKSEYMVPNSVMSSTIDRNILLKHSCELTLDLTTANDLLFLSEGHKKVRFGWDDTQYSPHPNRFDCVPQVLCKEALSGNQSYWEVEWTGDGTVIGVTYEGIKRKGVEDECFLGRNDQSWSLCCYDSHYSAWHNNKETVISSPRSSRIGVYVDFNNGTLEFYEVTDTITLMHTFKAKFTEPLYAGLWVTDSVTICQLSQSSQ